MVIGPGIRQASYQVNSDMQAEILKISDRREVFAPDPAAQDESV